MSYTGNKIMAMAAIAAMISLIVYLRSLGCGFVNLDDPDYVLNNPLIRKMDRELIYAAFTSSHAGWWMPLTWISFAVDFFFWGFNPLGYHLTNVILHSINTGLVVIISDRILRLIACNYEQSLPGVTCPDDLPDTVAFSMPYHWQLLTAGLLFGIHPLRVESVAWVAERKDVLNGLFVLGALFFYLCYVGKKDESGSGTRFYLISLVMFACSLMAKSVSVIFPLLLLLLDWYPCGRLGKVRTLQILLEKIPFLAMSAAMTVITIHFASESNYLVSLANFPLSQRFIVSGAAIYEYCWMILLPFGIIPCYLIPEQIPLSYTVKSIVVVIAFVAIISARGKYPWMLASMIAFLLPLLPVLAFLQNGDQAYAARFTYLPSVALSITAAALFTAICSKVAKKWRSLKTVAPNIVWGVLLFYAGMTLYLINFWMDTGTYWSRVIMVKPDAIAYKERGKFYYSVGRYEEAIEDLSRAIDKPLSVWQPYMYNLYAHRAEALRCAGQYELAIRDFTIAIAGYPHPVYFHFRGLALQAIGRVVASQEDFRQAGEEKGPILWYWEKR